MIKWLVTKFVISKVNDLLDQYKDNVSKVRETLKVWIARLNKILFAFRSLLEKLSDNKLDDDELDQTVIEVEQVIKEW